MIVNSRHNFVLGYINNPAEEMYIQTPNYQETITDGIVKGLADYFSN